MLLPYNKAKPRENVGLKGTQYTSILNLHKILPGDIVRKIKIILLV